MGCSVEQSGMPIESIAVIRETLQLGSVQWYGVCHVDSPIDAQRGRKDSVVNRSAEAPFFVIS